MKVFVFLAMSLTLSALCSSSSTRRSDNTPPDGAKDRDTPFWAPRGKKSNVAESIRCGSLRPFEETEVDSTWAELDSSERFFDSNSDMWMPRIKRSSALAGVPTTLDNETRRRLWLLKTYMDPLGNRMNTPRNLDLLSSWLKLVEKRKGGSGNSGNTNTNTDANNVPFWAARG